MSFSKRSPRIVCPLILCFATFLSLLAIPCYGQKVHVLVTSDQSEWAGWGEHVSNIALDSAFFSLAFEKLNVVKANSF